MPGSEKGWIGVPYGRIEPLATPMAVIADTVTSFRDDLIAEGDYQAFMGDVIATLGLSALDKSFMSSLSSAAQIFDVKNFSQNSLAYSASSLIGTGAGVAGLGGVGGLMRMIGDWSNPYESVAREDNNLIGNVLGLLQQRMLGGVGIPKGASWSAPSA